MNHLTIDINPLQTFLEKHQEAFWLFEELLVDENKKFNLTRITSPQQVRTRHFLDSLAGLGFLDSLSKQLQKPLRILDIGSGAGFPGLVLALVRPEWSVVSLEATEKKVRFQEKVCKALNLNNVQVIHGRAEDLAHQTSFRETFDAVTVRALAQMSVLSELAIAFLQKKGIAIFWKGSDLTKEVQQAETPVKQMGGIIDQIASYTLHPETEASIDFSLVVCRKIHSTPKKYPRVFGIIKKHPLGNTV
ncbi:MAG: 16S rRNA (guanine(527)-N(7))-methyltransferase RsmG [Phycisphaerae bacterium]|nr:16S rRNA (guanine(527)-N(7))-methyltransferase RsmG [Phycisphaerae bacterium]